MEGQLGHDHPLWLTSLAFGGNASDVSHTWQDYPNQQVAVAASMSQMPSLSPPLSQWIHCLQTSHNCIEYLSNSDVSESQREMLYNNVGGASRLKPAVSSVGLDTRKVEENRIIQDPKCLRAQNEGPMINLTSAEYQMHLQAFHTSQKQKSKEPHSRVVTPGFSSKPHNQKVSRRRATANDRSRRLRIDERLDALQELLPHPKEGSKLSLLDDIIDHIKYLQLQLKELSQSRLGGESISNPSIFFEGYGHYLVNEQQMLNEPLEEMMGKLLEVNPAAATQLLDSRGLIIFPPDLAEE
ncbi:transcription factor LRL2-like [Diospyros lotus]|uniref:transcription factor LRL2-like n=1 Tax=Diospyros lotus TaxID=55363 RepID=UPI0022560114|nr:transcription factor LRL2-like [Diospyros lotus]